MKKGVICVIVLVAFSVGAQELRWGKYENGWPAWIERPAAGDDGFCVVYSLTNRRLEFAVCGEGGGIGELVATRGALVYGEGETPAWAVLAAGSAGQVLTMGENEPAWASVAEEVDGVVGNEVTDVTDTTLTRGGSGTLELPYTLGLNLDNANTWTGLQTFSNGTTSAGAIALTEDADNGSHFGTVSAPSALTDSYTWTFPDKSGTIAMTSDITAGTYVSLQSTTPGTADTGHFSVTGSGLVGGRVGVGMTAPSYKFDLTASGDSESGDTGAVLRLRQSNTGYTYGPSIILDASARAGAKKWALRSSADMAPINGFSIRNLTDNVTAFSIITQADASTWYKFGPVATTTLPFDVEVASTVTSGTARGAQFSFDTSASTSGLPSRFFVVNSIQRLTDQGPGSYLLEARVNSSGVEDPLTQDRFQVDSTGAATSVARGMYAIADATVQVGELVRQDAGTSDRFDVLSAGGTNVLGVYHGTEASSADSRYRILTSGLARVVPTEDATPTIGDIAYVDPNTAGKTAFHASTIGGTQIGYVTRTEALYTVCHTGECVEEASDVITLSSAPSDWSLGDALVYWDSGGTAIGGLTSGNTYFLIWRSLAQIKVSATRGGTQVNVTSDGDDSTQYFTRLTPVNLYIDKAGTAEADTLATVTARGATTSTALTLGSVALTPTGDGIRLSTTLDDATGDQVAVDVLGTVNKATSGATTVLRVMQQDTATPGTEYLQEWGTWNGSAFTQKGYIDSAGLIRGTTLGNSATNYMTGSGFTSALYYRSLGASVSLYAAPGVAAGSSVVIAGNTFTGPSVAQQAVSIAPTWNQTGTSSGTDLLINRTETAVGSGAQNLIDAQVATVSKFKVDNTGAVATAGAITVTEDGIATTPTNGLSLINSTAATSGVPVQMSPRLTLTSHGYDTDGADSQHDWYMDVLPASAATTTSTIRLGVSVDGGATSTAASLTNGGVFITNDRITGKHFFATSAATSSLNSAQKLTMCTDGFVYDSDNDSNEMIIYMPSGVQDASDTTTYLNVASTSLAVTQGAAATTPGLTQYANDAWAAVILDYADVTDTDGDKTVTALTLPAKALIKAAFVINETPAAGTACSAVAVSLGTTGDSDVDTLIVDQDSLAGAANAVWGDADAERGTDLPDADVMGAELYSYTATQQLDFQVESTDCNLNALTAGQWRIIVSYAVLP